MCAILETKKLTKLYEQHLILDEISFQVKKSEIVVILGPSGCGKSTFLRCLNGLEEIQNGEILLDGKKIESKKDWQQARQRIGMVFQSYDLFPHMNVLDNIMLAPLKVQKRQKSEVEEQAKDLLNRMGLGSKLKAMPKELSGGQKQRVAIARALCNRPEILLLDEITASLDPEMVKEVLEIVLQLAKEGMTMIIVTHEMAFARKIADRILFFDQGKVLDEGRAEEIFTSPKHDRVKKFLQIFEY